MSVKIRSRWELLEDRYLLAALLIVASIITYAVAGDHRAGQLTVVIVQSLTLIVILQASHASRRTMSIASVAIGLALAGALVSMSLDRQSIGPGLVGAILAFVGPVMIVRRVMHHQRIDLETVAASLCIYLLAGLFFAYVYGILHLVDGPFFAQTRAGAAIDFVYYSFTTLTTLGYGDLTSQLGIGRMLSISEALLGQLYLVSVVALLVANIGRPRGEARSHEESEESEEQ